MTAPERPGDGEPVVGQPCPVCGLPDPDHDWDVHDQAPEEAPGRFGAALPNMLLRSSTRGRHRVRVLCLHTTEGILRARDLRAWAGWKGSSHASADADGTLLGPGDGFVPYHLAAWTLRSGSPWSENIELCAFARWTRPEWLARPKLLEAAARWLAERHRATGIPLVKITAAQYRAGGTGVIDHDDHTDGYQDGTHWDVGENFPWDVVIPRARVLAGATIEEDEVRELSDEDVTRLAAAVSDNIANRGITATAGKPVHAWQILRDLYARTAGVRVAAEPPKEPDEPDGRGQLRAAGPRKLTDAQIRVLAKASGDAWANRIITSYAGRPVHTWEILRELHVRAVPRSAPIRALRRVIGR